MKCCALFLMIFIMLLTNIVFAQGTVPCWYIPGDANGDGNFNGLDVVYSVNYLKGIGPIPPDSCNCPPNGTFSSAADANGSCQFNGLDVTYSINYLKGIGPVSQSCPDCPPSRMVVFYSNRDGNEEIYSCNLDGGNLRRLTDNPASDDSPKISMSHDKIAFMSDRSGTRQLYVMDIDGGDQTRISDRLVEGFCGWTTDGKIIYSGGTTLYKINSDGTNEISLAVAPGGKHFTEITCSPTSNKIACTVIGSWGYDRTIYLMNDDGTDMTVFLPDVPGYTANNSFSPDGNKICYTQDISGHEEGSGRSLDDHIFLINIDNTDNVDISVNKPANTNDQLGVFTPDSTKILFVNSPNDISTVYDIWIMNIDGSNRTRIVSNGFIGDCR